jgi:hypothetical protein
LFAYLARANLSRIVDPQLESQLARQSFEPAAVSAGFHPDPHLFVVVVEFSVELLS